jgi:hypothetical protein
MTRVRARLTTVSKNPLDPTSRHFVATQQSCSCHSGRTVEQVRSRRLSAVQHLLGPAGSCAASSDVIRAPHKRDAPRYVFDLGHARRRRGDARGSVASPEGLLQNELVERQIRHCPAKPGIPCVKILQPLHVLGLRPSKLLAPAIVRNLGYADLADRINNALTLRDQHIDLPQPRDNLLRLVRLLRHIDPP